VVTSIFPQLSSGSRGAYRLGLLALLLTMVTFAVLRWQVPAITVAILGFPVLLVVFLRESGVASAVPRRIWLLTVASGIGLGIGWALVSGALVAENYGLGLGAGLAGGPKNSETLGVPLGTVLAMMLPATLVRLYRGVPDGSGAGFAIGLVGASSFGAAVTLMHLSPQFATGLVAGHRPVVSLVVEAGIRGVAIPVTSAAIGGLVGVGLWFTRRGGGACRGRAVGVLGVVAAAMMVVSIAGNRLTDAWSSSQLGQLAAHLAFSAAVLFLARIALHLALLHEAHAGGDPGRVVTCRECAAPTPAVAFCTNCGVARSLAVPRDNRVSTTPPNLRVLVRLGGGLLVVVTAATAVSMLTTKRAELYSCPPECGRPPIGTPIELNPRYTAKGGEFSVEYPPSSSAYDISTGPDWIIASTRDGEVLRLSGEPARGRTARQVAQDLLREVAPNASTAYRLPNAMVGYQIGYGEVADDYPQNASGDYSRLRIVVLAAVRDDYALIAAAGGPFRQFGPDFGPGPPSAVNLRVAINMDRYVNSFRWLNRKS
jgi:hypothetical protein